MIEDTSLKNDDGIRIGSNIRRVREALNMKPGKLVKEVNLKGVDLNTFSLSKIESDRQHVRASQFRAIKEVLDCSYDELLKREGDKG